MRPRAATDRHAASSIQPVAGADEAQRAGRIGVRQADPRQPRLHDLRRRGVALAAPSRSSAGTGSGQPLARRSRAPQGFPHGREQLRMGQERPHDDRPRAATRCAPPANSALRREVGLTLRRALGAIGGGPPPDRAGRAGPTRCRAETAAAARLRADRPASRSRCRRGNTVARSRRESSRATRAAGARARPGARACRAARPPSPAPRACRRAAARRQAPARCRRRRRSGRDRRVLAVRQQGEAQRLARRELRQRDVDRPIGGAAAGLVAVEAEDRLVRHPPEEARAGPRSAPCRAARRRGRSRPRRWR